MFQFPEKYHIALVAPAGPCPPETVAAGKAVLESCGCRVTLMPHLFCGTSLSHLAADDSGRAADINNAFADESVDLVWAVRGGCGAMRILDLLDWQMIKNRDIPLAGFSDITALHWAMAKHDCPNHLAAPMMTFLSAADDSLSGETLFQALCGEKISLKLQPLRRGEVSGTPLPGNLAVAAAMCGTPYFPDTSGKVVILEEINEAPYRVDRMLTQLRLAGAFAECAGVVFGRVTGCGSADELGEVLHDFTAHVSCPVYTGLPCGHELPFYSISGRQEISVTPQC